jgi:hypothetical protein
MDDRADGTSVAVPLDLAAGWFDLLDELPQPPAWHRRAACASADPDLFFPPQGDRWTVLNAKQVCAGCPVRQRCADEAIDDDSLHGVWGGLTAEERRKLRKAAA